MTTPLEIVKMMESSQSEQEWDANCDKVKEANGGYPNFWYSLIIISGVFADTEARWKQSRSEGLPNVSAHTQKERVRPSDNTKNK